MEPYVGIAVFELLKSSSKGTEKRSFFREDIYIVYADDMEGAKKRVGKLIDEQVSHPPEEPSVVLRHIIDIAPALYGYVDKDCDLYSRHFNSLEDYKRFEMKLGAVDPLVEG